MTTYRIVRFHKEGLNEVIKTGLTLEEVQAHCSDPSSQGEDWFDGWTVDVEDAPPPNDALYPPPTGPMTQEEYDALVERARNSATMYCLYGEVMFYRPDTKAFGPGHIYSEAGVSEARISGCCEYHFDEMWGDDE